MDVDDLVAQCIGALDEATPQLAVRDILERATAAANLGEPTPGLTVLYNAPDLTVLNVVWPPLVTLFPHNHLMWAAIALYGGTEENTFYRRDGSTLVVSGGKEVQPGQPLLLGDDAIHSVHNPARAYAGAIHVYGGDFVRKPRSQWTSDPPQEEPYDFASVRGALDAAEQRFRAEQPT